MRSVKGHPRAFKFDTGCISCLLCTKQFISVSFCELLSFCQERVLLNSAA